MNKGWLLILILLGPNCFAEKPFVSIPQASDEETRLKEKWRHRSDHPTHEKMKPSHDKKR